MKSIVQNDTIAIHYILTLPSPSYLKFPVTYCTGLVLEFYSGIPKKSGMKLGPIYSCSARFIPCEPYFKRILSGRT